MNIMDCLGNAALAFQMKDTNLNVLIFIPMRTIYQVFSVHLTFKAVLEAIL